MPPQSILPGLPVERWPCSAPHSQPQQEGQIQTLLERGWEMSPGGSLSVSTSRNVPSTSTHPWHPLTTSPTWDVPNYGPKRFADPVPQGLWRGRGRAGAAPAGSRWLRSQILPSGGEEGSRTSSPGGKIPKG